MDLFVSLDFFGTYLHWYVNRQKKVYTSLGGILTSISVIICFIISAFYFSSYIKRENPQTTENDETNTEFKKIKFGEEKIYVPWTIADYHIKKVNFTGYIFPVIYYFYGERDKQTGTLPYDYKILNYKYCNETNLNSLDYFQDSYVNFDTLYCIDMEDLFMGGDWFHDFVYHIQMDFFLCEDGVNFGTKGKKCTNDTELTKIIGADNAWHIEIYYPEVQFNPKNKKQPLQIFYNTHFYNFNKLNTKVERFYFKEYIMVDDKGWFFKNEKYTKFWGFDQIDSDTYSRSPDGNDFITDFSSSKIYSLVIYLSRNTKIFTRKYTKLLDALGNMISIINGIFIFFKFFSQFFTEAYQDQEIVDNVFIQKYNMDEKFREISERRKMLRKKLYSDNLVPIINQKKKQDQPVKNIFPMKALKSFDHLNVLNNQNNINKSWNDLKNKNIKICSKVDKGIESIKNLKSLDLFIMNKEKESAIDNLQISKNCYFAFDNSSFINIPQKNIVLNTVKKDQINLYKKKYSKESYSIGINNRLSLNKQKNYRFAYYLYLLNIFNKNFSTTKMCCISKNFLNTWKYMINIIDVTKYFQLQTNVDSINKILFELKTDGEKSNIKRCFKINGGVNHF